MSLIDINDEVLVTDDTTLMESGWSYFDKRMLKMQVSYKSDEECVEQYGAQQYIPQSMICIEEAIDCLVQVLPICKNFTKNNFNFDLG